MKSLFLCFASLSLFLGSIPAQLIQTTGALSTLRSTHQSQVLQNGQVLTFGGQNGGALASAELYDPSSGLWTEVEPMQQARAQFASALLDNGQVLAIGGSDGTDETNTCELYDPATGKWSFTGSLSLNTSFVSAVKLQDGRVLMNYLTTCEIYHPDSAAWFPAASLSTQRSRLVLLADGKVLSAGLSTSAEVYDPATDTWTPVANDLDPGASGVNVFNLLGDGRVLISGSNKTTVAYNPSTNSFEDVPDMPERLNQPGSISTTNGNVLVFGISSSTDPGDTKTVQVFNAAQNQWFTSVFSLNGPGRNTLVQLDNGDILSVGGVAPLGGFAPDCYLINENAAALSINEMPGQRIISPFPNPAQNMVHLEWEEAQAGKMEWFDLQGRLLLRTDLLPGLNQVSIAHFANGIYVYHLQNSLGQHWQGKIEKY